MFLINRLSLNLDKQKETITCLTITFITSFTTDFKNDLKKLIEGRRGRERERLLTNILLFYACL
jgi:hypothetical protein